MRTIMHAKRLHLLLPFALPAVADAASALHALQSPALDKLLARATLVERVAGEDFQRTLPHERWIARQFGAVASSAADEAPLAPYMLLADGGTPGDAVWACVEPVHIRVAHDHLVLLDPASLSLADEDALALFAVAQPLVQELGVRIEAPTPKRWYLSGETLSRLASASPQRASGRSIEIWLPHDAHTGQRSRAWMKLQNEVQMAWFEHPVNEAREARGLAPVNSLWLHGHGAAQPVKSPFGRVFSNAAATRGLALAAGVEASMAPSALRALPATNNATATNSTTLVELDAFATPFVQQDWQNWSTALAGLEREWFAPVLAALRAGELDALVVTLAGDTSSVTLSATRSDLRRFWRHRVLASLFE
ncbi:regulator [Trinickia sp. LjRoot230]|uniref:regulator n=1 Tax=Trinickia sp. LjRoot230 TaxID=3342288 RepID=UPI003ECE7B4B